jgi:AraC-like DNA-binding protein/quercetin dioxygenase-like cupin family protein
MKVDLAIPPEAEGFSVLVGQPQARYRPHHHDELEVNLVLAGRAAYLLKDQRVPLAVGSMIWLFPKQEHVLIDCSHDFSMWVVVFKPGLVQRHTRHPTRRILRSPDPGEIFCRQVDSRRMYLLDRVYPGGLREGGDLDLRNTALAYALLASWQAYQFSQEPTPRTDVHPAVARAARLLSESDESLPLEKLAQQAGLSAPRLSRLFKQQTGVGLTVFRQRKCLERFLRIYHTGARYSLIEAALLAGFGSYPQFHRVFRHIMGQSPAGYKRASAGKPL